MIVIKQADTGTGLLDNVFLLWSTHRVMPVRQARLRRNVLKDDRACLDESASCNWPVLGIEYRRERTRRRRASLRCGLSVRALRRWGFDRLFTHLAGRR